MKTVIVNHKKYIYDENTPLKTALKDLGYVFPCGGQGKCGKCIINCKELGITDLDRRFLSDTKLESGLRLACDKTINQDLEIACTIKEASENMPLKKLSSCRIAVSIGSRFIDIGILDDDLAETITIANPLHAIGNLTSIANAYKHDKTSLTIVLKAAIGKESVELFEKYSTAKAETMAIAANGFYLNILLGLDLDLTPDYDTLVENDNLNLPTESVYILPVLNCYVGGDIFAETIELKENSLLIDCEDILTFASIGSDQNLITSMWDIDMSSNLSLKCFAAALDYMLYKQNALSLIYLFGKYPKEIEDIIIDKGLDFVPKKKTLNNIAKACVYYRYRTKLNKEKNRSTAIKLLNDDKYQEFLLENE